MTDRAAVLDAMLSARDRTEGSADYVRAITIAVLCELDARPYASRRAHLLDRICELAGQHPLTVADAMDAYASQKAAEAYDAIEITI